MEAIILIILSAGLWGCIKKLTFFNPLKTWLILQTIFYIGTFYISDFSNQIHSNYFNIYSLFIFSSILGVLFLRKSKKRIRLNIVHADIKYVYISFYVSILLCCIYFLLVGSNLFVESLQSLYTSGSGVEDIANRRYEYYSGRNYYAPGFFNLFKNYLLPASFFSVFLLHLTKYKKRSTQYIVVSFILYIVLILGTGQRGAFILSVLYGFLICYYFLGKKSTYKKFRIIGIVFFFIFVLSTFFLGRTSVGNITDSENFLKVAESSIDRVLMTNQLAGLYSFEYVTKYEEIQWGYDWLMGLEQFLPGQSSYVNISNKVFAYLYGSTRGTTPPTLVGSVYYNFGIIGIFLFPLFFIYIVNLLYRRFLRSYSSYKDFFIYLFLYFSISTWVISGLDYPLRNGLLLYFLLIIIRKFRP